MKKNWLEEMIEREAIPEPIRDITTKQFCIDNKLTESTYYYHAAKSENQKKILEITLRLAKKHAPEILENLGVRAKSDNKATELYLNFVLELSKKLDLKVEGEISLTNLLKEYEIEKGETNNATNG